MSEIGAMMDIVVTIPKNMLDQVEEEEKQVKEAIKNGEEINYFWKLGRKPKDLKEGDKCYFVWDGAIRAYHEVVGFSEDMTCGITGIHHSGFCAILDPVIHNIDPIPMKGFQGFRYRNKI